MPGCRHQLGSMVGGCRCLCSPAVAERVQHELDAVGNAQLFEDAENVVLHRMFTEVELSRDIAVAQGSWWETQKPAALSGRGEGGQL